MENMDTVENIESIEEVKDLEIKSLFLHHIDVKGKLATPIILDDNSVNIKLYVNSLVNEIILQPNKRLYKFKDGNTEVKSSLKSILDEVGDIDNVILSNAKRLLEKETITQEKINRLDKEIQKGSLLHLHFNLNETNQIIICKVEHDEVLSETGFNFIKGLNTKKKVFKAILLCFDEHHNITDNYIFDKNSSKFWWDDFLELIQINTDDKNTEKSLNAIDIILSRQKQKYFADYIIVRNTLIGHYRTKKEFNFTGMISEVFSSYEPINKEFPIGKIVGDLKELPIKKGFDTQFSIVKTSINKRVQNKIKLANNLYLNIDDYVENLKNIIEPFEENGNKYIKILSADGYEILKDLLKNDTQNS